MVAAVEISRTFIVRVTTSPLRVIVEDVRERRRAVAAELPSIGTQISTWLESSVTESEDGYRATPREDSVSPRT